MAKCEKCGQEQTSGATLFPKLLSERIAELRKRAEEANSPEGVELCDILALLESRPGLHGNGWLPPNPFLGPLVPYQPPTIPVPYVGDPPGWPTRPTVICGGNTSDTTVKQSDGSVATFAGSVPDATGVSNPETVDGLVDSLSAGSHVG